MVGWAQNTDTEVLNEQEVLEQFEEPQGALDGCKLLMAVILSGMYEGEAFVLFERDGDLFEVLASHCSCYGFEGQWNPQPTTVAALRAQNGSVFANDPALKKELESILDKWSIS